MSALAKVEVVIKDACILFDLLDLELLGSFYELKLMVITRPEVLAEITDEDQLGQLQPYIDSGNLQIDGVDVLEIAMAIVETNPGLSLTDAAVLETASRREATILSSDKSLRNESTRRGIAVRGLLWVLEELFNEGVLPSEVVLEKLALYPEVNRRAPKTEIASLVTRLQKQAADGNSAPEE